MKNKTIDKEIKEKALDYLNSHSYIDTAKIFNISKSTLERWARFSELSFLNRRFESKNNKKNRIYAIDINKLQEIINKSSSLSNVLVNLGLDPRSHYKMHLINRIYENKLDTNNFSLNMKIRLTNNNKAEDSNKLCKNSKLSRSSLREKILKIQKYECVICKNDGNYFGNKLTLQIDHINGINNDNRVENIRILCPNCHSQQETSFGKNNKK
jgi:hypothetical protein